MGCGSSAPVKQTTENNREITKEEHDVDSVTRCKPVDNKDVDPPALKVCTGI